MNHLGNVQDLELLGLDELPEGWKYLPLGELVDSTRGISYGIVQPGSFTKDGIPIVRVNNLQNGRIIAEDVLKVSPTIEEKYQRTRLRGGEVLLSLVGSLGQTSVVPSEIKGWNVARAVAVIPVLPEISPEWVNFVLRSPQLQHFIWTWATTTVQATLNLGDVVRLPIPVPPEKERKAIIEILGALDDKIELNRRVNRTLESMARAVFRQWFVEGDDVESWDVGDIYQIADVIYEAPFSSSLFNSEGNGLPLIRIRDLSNHNPEIFTPEIHPKQTVIKAADVIVGMDGEFRVHHWKGPDALLNQRMCFFKPKNGIPRVFVAESIREHLEFFERAKVGTTVIHLGKADIDTFKIAIPPKDLLNRFGEIANPILDKIVANEKESRTLASLRDSLLPKLMRGEVRVNGL